MQVLVGTIVMILVTSNYGFGYVRRNQPEKCLEHICAMKCGSTKIIWKYFKTNHTVGVTYITKQTWLRNEKLLGI